MISGSHWLNRDGGGGVTLVEKFRISDIAMVRSTERLTTTPSILRELEIEERLTATTAICRQKRYSTFRKIVDTRKDGWKS